MGTVPPFNERHIVLGVDFGTTFTGVAYADSRRPDAIQVIQDWRNHEGKLVPAGKVPTKLCYERDGSFRWGSLIAPDASHDDVLEYFKLGLDPQHVDKLENGRGSSLTKKNLLGQDIDKLVTEFLTGLGEHVVQRLRHELGPEVVDNTNFHVVITVPAIWRDTAIARTVNALKRAWGTNSKPSTWKVTTLTEPEAAAICVLQQMPKHEMKEDDCIMVVDAGGGTVDLITYRIDGLTPCLRVEEAVPGAGGACGAAFLNERFERFLLTTIGQEDGFEQELVEGALRKWDQQTKRRFSMEDIPAGNFAFDAFGLSDNRDLNIRRSRWNVSATDVFRIFDGVVLQILKLVTDQQAACQTEVKAIVLVGGFGRSTYLRERLQAHVGMDIRILQPGNAWTAVVEGAVLKGLSEAVTADNQITILNRKARKNFGFEVSNPFNHILHHSIAGKKRWDSYTGQDVVDVMQWFIRKGDSVTESQPYFRGFTIISRVNHGRQDNIVLVISSDTSDIAPLDHTGDVRTLCVVEADLSAIPTHQIPQKVGADGMMYYVVDCEVEIRCELTCEKTLLAAPYELRKC